MHLICVANIAVTPISSEPLIAAAVTFTNASNIVRGKKNSEAEENQTAQPPINLFFMAEIGRLSPDSQLSSKSLAILYGLIAV